MDIVLLATAWGPRFGGINAFNQDFAIGLSARLERTGRVFCAVPDPTAAELEDAKSNNVILVSVLNKRNKDEFDDSWTHDVLAWLGNEYPGAHGDWWVGHDVVSGEAAIRGASLAGGAAALIHHMNYIDYYAFKHDDAPSADAKHRRQQALFEKSALHFAVGPLLQRSCESLSGGEVTLLVPGFPEVPASRVSEKSIVAITFGRMEAVDDRIKQGQLAVAAFGEAIKQTASSSVPVERLINHSRMYIIGLEEDAQAEAQDLIKSAERRAGRVLKHSASVIRQEPERASETAE